jgi:hypothetical protein
MEGPYGPHKHQWQDRHRDQDFREAGSDTIGHGQAFHHETDTRPVMLTVKVIVLRPLSNMTMVVAVAARPLE